VVEATVMLMEEILALVGWIVQPGGLGVGGLVSRVVPCPSAPSAVSILFPFLALDLKPYAVLLFNLLILKLVQAASDFHDAEVPVVTLPLDPPTQKPFQSVSVDDACMAKSVVGLEPGLPFSLWVVMVRVDVAAEPMVGASGTAARVYVSELVVNDPVFCRESREATL